MNTIVDLGSEWLVDASRIRDPYVRLLLASVGEGLAGGSPWFAVDKQVAAGSGFVWDTAGVGPKGFDWRGPGRPYPVPSTARLTVGHAACRTAPLSSVAAI